MKEPFLSSVAWFNLSEGVKRNERERVLFLFRLLSHSVKSEAFRLQVLGDIYFSLGEKTMAIMSYKDAFMLSIFQHDVYSSYIIFLRILWQIEDPIQYLEILENHFSNEEKKPYKCFFNEILKSFKQLNKKNKNENEHALI
jgi:hypothetical protein